MFIQLYGSVITARKLSLGQGNVFTVVCLHRGGRLAPQYASQVTWPTSRGEGSWLPSMHHRSHDQWEGSASRWGRVCSQGEEGLHPKEWGSASKGGVCVQGRGLHLRGGVSIQGVGVCIQGRGLHPGEGVCIQGTGSESRGGVCMQGKEGLLECFLVKNWNSPDLLITKFNIKLDQLLSNTLSLNQPNSKWYLTEWAQLLVDNFFVSQ